MQSPELDLNRRLADALRANPTAVAGLSDFDDREGDLECALEEVRVMVCTGKWQPNRQPNRAGILLYAMIRVAQQEYGGDDPGYWKYLASRLGIELGADRQRLLGKWFWDDLDHFGYQFDVPGLAYIGPIIWHAGWARHQLRQFVGFVAAQVKIYGDRAAEPDAPHALRLGLVARGWAPSLPRTVVRLLSENVGGVGDLWSRLARAVIAARQGKELIRATWDPIGGISAEDILDAVRANPVSCTSSACPVRPRLRYHHDTGEIRLRLVEGETHDWRVDGLKLHWQGSSACVLPPLSGKFTLTHLPSDTTWEETLFVGQYPAIWFGGRSGALERGEVVSAQGLSAGPWYLICRGALAGMSANQRCPLALGFYAGGDGWSAWEVQVPERSDRDGCRSLDLTVANETWRFPLARGTTPLALPQTTATWSFLKDDTRVALYPAPPSVGLRQGTQIRLICRSEMEGTLVRDWIASEGPSVLPDAGPGVFQLREARGVGRVLLDYAVIPGLSTPTVSIADGTARLTFFASSGGRLVGGVPVLGGWSVERPDVEPWLEATWQWDRPRVPPMQVRVPARAVRWQLTDQTTPLSGWKREPLPVSHRDAAAKKLRLRCEVPTADVLVNGNPPADEPTETPTGWAFSIRLHAFPKDDAIRLRTGDQEFVAAWLTDRPVLRGLEAELIGTNLNVHWEAEHMPSTVVLSVWDPTDPAAAEVIVPVAPNAARTGNRVWPLPAGAGKFRRLSVALGTQVGQGFGQKRFFPGGSARDGTPVAALIASSEAPDEIWVELAHEWTVWQRWGGGEPPAIIAGLSRLGNSPPLDDILQYFEHLPASSPLKALLREALSRCARAIATEHIAAADDPAAALRAWLAVGVHPLWLQTPTTRSRIDGAYPLHYLSCLNLLDNSSATLDSRRDAARDVYQFHKKHELFSPLHGLPGTRSIVASAPIAVQGRTREGATHVHRMQLLRSSDDEDQFVAQTTGYDCVWEMHAVTGDPFPRMSLPGGRGAVQYAATQYEVGWDDEGFWRVGRRVTTYCGCCQSTTEITVRPWQPSELVGHLKLFDWILARSKGIGVPSICLSEEFDALLFNGPLGDIHSLVLTTPRVVEHRLSGPFRVVGSGSIRRQERPDIPLAGKVAWRLAWLDRSSPDERSRLANWAPFLAALRSALWQDDPAWAELFAECIAIAEYVSRILCGGIGPVMRFSPAEVPRP